MSYTTTARVDCYGQSVVDVLLDGHVIATMGTQAGADAHIAAAIATDADWAEVDAQCVAHGVPPSHSACQ